MTAEQYAATEAMVTAIGVCIDALPLEEFAAVLDEAHRIAQQAECCETPEKRAARRRLRVLTAALLAAKIDRNIARIEGRK